MSTSARKARKAASTPFQHSIKEATPTLQRTDFLRQSTAAKVRELTARGELQEALDTFNALRYAANGRQLTGDDITTEPNPAEEAHA